VHVQDGLLHRHRDVVLHLEGERLAQLARGIQGRSTCRTTTFWFATPTTTFLRAELGLGPELLEGAATTSLSTTSPSRTAPGRQRHLAEPLQRGHALAERQLGGAHAGGPDVEPHYWSSCHCTSPQAAAGRPQDPSGRSRR
jgi:hypothetical protein